MNKNKHVFVVDDDSSILDYYRKIFADESAEFDILGGEKTANEEPIVLQLFSKPAGLLSYFSSAYQSGLRFPLCILDMRMPELNGLETAVRLRKQDPNINIIICSAFSDANANDIKQRLDNRVFLVHKPFVPDEFKLLVYSILREWETKQALLKSEARLRQLVDASRAGIWEWDLESDETIFSERWADILGYKLGELAPTTADTWANLVHPEDLKRAKLLLEKHVAGKIPCYDAEFRMKHKCGAWVWIHARGQIVERDSNGKALRISGTQNDITNRKQAEDALRTNSAFLSQMASSLPHAIVVVDHRTETILFSNQKFCDLWGIPDSLAFMESCKPFQSEENRTTFDDFIPFANGRTIRRYSAQMRDAKDGYIGRLYSFEDVTEPKQANPAP